LFRRNGMTAGGEPPAWGMSRGQSEVDLLEPLISSAGVRDNTPPGEQSQPDDPFVAFLNVQAPCIWTTQTKASIFDVFRGTVVRRS
jgi:hypothetical protein